MSYLVQAATAIPDAYKLSMSIWFRIPTIGGVPNDGSQQNLFNFGLNGVDDLLLVSRLYLYYDGGAGGWRIVFFGFGGGPNPNPFPPPNFFGMSNTWQSASTVLAYDTWHHLALGYDGSQSIVGDGFHALSGSPIFVVAKDRAILTGTAAASDPTFGIFDATSGSTGMYVQGFPVGFPLTTEQFSFPLEFTFNIKFAEVQMWFGRYIDFSSTTNLNKFIDATGKPVDPTVAGGAWSAYGVPTIAFRRSSRAKRLFQTNQGTGGAFSVVGTAPVDFTPGP